MCSIRQLLLGDVSNPLAGNEGWAGAGLLGAVLAWFLLKRVPDHDKHTKDLIANCDSHNEKIVKEFITQIQMLTAQHQQQRSEALTAIQQQRIDFQESLKFIAGQSEKNVMILAEALRQEVRAINEGRINSDNNRALKS